MRDFPAASVELREPFSSIAGVLELQDGRLLIVDQTEGGLFVVDVPGGTRRAVGRQGAGPGEYRVVAGLGRLASDTIWVIDATQGRIVVFNPGLTPGATFPFITLDAARGSALSAPLLTDLRGQLFATSITMNPASPGTLPDQGTIVRVDPRVGGAPVALATFKLPLSGQPRMQQAPGGAGMKFSMAFPGLAASDAWTVFRDGRVAIVRSDYSVEFISPSGARTSHGALPYERIPVTAEDRSAEMDHARKQMEQRTRMASRLMPSGVSVEFELLPPASWPDHYPPVAAMGVLAAPDGRLWVRRATPVRVGRERWDVLGQDGTLLERWQLPPRTTLLSVGLRGAYAVRTDDDDLRYLQRIELPR